MGSGADASSFSFDITGFLFAPTAVEGEGDRDEGAIRSCGREFHHGY
jgi:hypothetical protein